jgi:hypothetical protein
VFRLYIFLLFSLTANAQSVIQTFTDRCTGEVKTITVQATGYTTVFFYNQSRQFTAEEARNGALRVWMEEVYAWWQNISPCSTNQATNTAAQNTSSQATSNASSAAANATTNDTSSGNSAANSPPENESTQTSTETTTEQQDTQTETETETQTETETEAETETETESESTTEENETETEEQEEVVEEEQEETVEEEEQEEQEEQEETTEEEEKEEKKEKKQKNINPVIVSANVAISSSLDGSINRVINLGFSQSSLTGQQTYSANLMVWDNLNQFSLSAAKSHVFFNYDRKVPVMVGGHKFGDIYERGSIMKIQSMSANLMYIYGTKVASFGLSDVFLGQKENALKGFVGGYALSGTIINIEDQFMVSPSIVFFGTKPFPLKRLTISPMLAAAFNPISYSTVDNKITLNKYFTYIVGSNFDFTLSKRFRANIGGNAILNTNTDIPITWSITIGSKFKF